MHNSINENSFIFLTVLPFKYERFKESSKHEIFKKWTISNEFATILLHINIIKLYLYIYI